MANWTVVLPYTHELATWWTELGLTDLPAQESAAVTAEQVRQLLHAQGWLPSEHTYEHEGIPITSFYAQRRADGAWPPFSEIDVWPDSLSVRHGGYACWVLAVGASGTCGALIAWDEGGAGPVLCTPTTSYEQFSRAFGHPSDVERASAWSLPDDPPPPLPVPTRPSRRLPSR
ncbi:MAG TPA: hypothetical protein VFR07_13130 [Mycobacteriales bacterium]|nr:hypothetical protein [Mycobacteriales bacterium]